MQYIHWKQILWLSDNGRELFEEGTESERLDPMVQGLEESDILESTNDYDDQVNLEENLLESSGTKNQG